MFHHDPFSTDGGGGLRCWEGQGRVTDGGRVTPGVLSRDLPVPPLAVVGTDDPGLWNTLTPSCLVWTPNSPTSRCFLSWLRRQVAGVLGLPRGSQDFSPGVRVCVHWDARSSEARGFGVRTFPSEGRRVHVLPRCTKEDTGYREQSPGRLRTSDVVRQGQAVTPGSGVWVQGGRRLCGRRSKEDTVRPSPSDLRKRG